MGSSLSLFNAHTSWLTKHVDLSMPVMDGTTSSREIRTYKRETGPKKSTTIIALTGLASATARVEALASGIDHFMTKPVKLKKLLSYLQRQE
jgi:CheY-like chemotaxis protein